MDFGLPILKKKTVEWCLTASNRMQGDSTRKIIRDGIQEMGFKDIFSQENQLTALKFCMENGIDLIQNVENLHAGESEEEMRSESDILDAQAEVNDTDEDDECDSIFSAETSESIITQQT